MLSEPKKALEIFFSYSHIDQNLRDQLSKHLSVLQNQGAISSWHDREIIAGTEWAREIDEHLEASQIILLLVSSDFLASPYINGIEVKRAMEKYNAGQARVIPVVLRPCDWQSTLFGKLQALPIDGRPVVSQYWHSKDEAFLNVVQGTKKTIGDIQALKKPTITQSDTPGSFFRTGEKLPLLRPKMNKSFDLYEVRDEWVDYITSNLRDAIESEESLNFYANNSQECRQIHITFNSKTIYSLDIYKDSTGGSQKDDGISFSYAEGRASFRNGFNASGHFKWNRQREMAVLDLLDLSLINTYGGNKEYTKEEFLHALWEKIRSIIERQSI